MMKKTTLLLVTLFLIFSVTAIHAQKDEFKPHVDLGGTLYTGWNDNLSNNNLISSFDTTQANNGALYGYNPKTNSFEVSQNSFFVERAYINILAYLAPNIKGRITPDIVQIPGSTTAYALELKYAWVDWTAFKQTSGLSLDFTMGIIPNRWISTAEKYWGYRGIAKTLTDYSYLYSVSVGSKTASGKPLTLSTSTNSYFSSADLGLEANLNLPKGYGELYLNVLNGNGYKNLGYDNRFKDLMGTLFLHPLAANINKKMDAAKKNGKDRINGLADLTLGGFLYLGHLTFGEIGFYNLDGTTGYPTASTQYIRNRFGGMASARYNFKNAGFVKIGGEFSVEQNQDPGKTIASPTADTTLKYTATGLSVYLEFNPPVKQLQEKLSIIARYDMFNPKVPTPNPANETQAYPIWDNVNDKQSLLILGLAYKPVKVCTFALSYQGTTYQQPIIVKRDGTTSKSSSRLIVHGILEF